MATRWFEAKYSGKCGGCNQPYEPGFRILVDIQEKRDAQGKVVMKGDKPDKTYKTMKCDACDGTTDTQQRRENDAAHASSLPANIEQMVAKCGTLAEALQLLGNYSELEVSLNAVGRTFKELAMAAVTACLSSSSLPKCEPMSWVIALQGAAASGMIPDPGMGPAAVAYFVPRGGKVSLDLSYRGLCQLAFNGRSIKAHHEEVIWECEVVLGELVSLLRSSHAYEREAGEKLRQQLIDEPDQTLSPWDRDVIAQALAKADGLAYPWFRYQESPQVLLHRRPRWFTAPMWSDSPTSTLPWGAYVSVEMVQGGRAIVVLTRDQCYERAVRGGNVKLSINEKGDGRPRLVPGTSWGKWATTPWCRDQFEMMKKTAIRDVMTGGKVPVNVRTQRALAAEIIDGEFSVINPATTLDQHLRGIVGGQRVPETHLLEDGEEAPDYAAEQEALAQREPVPVGGGVAAEQLQRAMASANDSAIMDAYDLAGVPAGVMVEDMTSEQRAAMLKALGGGR